MQAFVHVNTCMRSTGLVSDPTPSARCFTEALFPCQEIAMCLVNFPLTAAIGREQQSVHYQEVSKAFLPPFPSQIISQTYAVISPFSPSSFHSSVLCYFVSLDTPFLPRGSRL